MLRSSLFALAMVAVLASCSPEKRLARLVAKHPELVKTDTIFRIDTTIVDGVTHDTVFRSMITRDTMIIKDKQLTIKYYNDGTTTYLKGVCDTVRIFKEVPVVVHSVSPVRDDPDWWLYGVLVLLCLIIFYLIFLRRK